MITAFVECILLGAVIDLHDRIMVDELKKQDMHPNAKYRMHLQNLGRDKLLKAAVEVLSQ